MEFIEDFEKNGYALIKGVFSKKENDLFREISDEYFANYPSLSFEEGKCLCGYSGVTPELKDLNTLHKDQRIIDIVKQILGEDFIFAEHSDLHQNKLTPWHRDLLMGAWSQYQKQDPWSEDYKIIKVAALLQDHSDNDYGLWVVPESHNKRNEDPSLKELKEQCIHSEEGDLIVFDQRIFHKGQLKQYLHEYKRDRYLITFGYGLNNSHTEDHMKGTAARQNTQRQNLKLP